jgi:hypothetical protein
MARRNNRPKGGTMVRPIEKIAVPRGRCHFRSAKGKLRFLTEQDAQTALDQARATRARQHNSTAEKRFYRCELADGGCGDFHLTSLESWTPRGSA